ncbi:MAG: SDR family oxidoreductase [Dongiaceae bacterium]
MFDIAGKIALITGGSSGIGRATAERFAAAGATVVIANRTDASALAAGLGAEFVATDVADEAQVAALVETVVRRHGRIDVLVNSAGIITDMKPLTELSAAALQLHFAVNTLGVWATMRHAAPHMAGGSIVNVASGAGLIGLGGYGAYSASKAAVISLTQTAAVDLADRKIRVNCVCPGSVDTPMLRNQANADEEIAVLSTAATVGRVGRPEEIAAVIHFLAADDCGFVNGQAIVADGGVLALYSNKLFETLVAATAKR